MRNSCEMIVSKRFEEQEMVAGDFSYFDTAFAFLCKACGRNVLIVSIIGHSVVHIGSVFVNFQYVVHFATRLSSFQFRSAFIQKTTFRFEILNKITNGKKRRKNSLTFIPKRNFLTLAAMMIYDMHSRTFARPWWFTDMTFQVCSFGFFSGYHSWWRFDMYFSLFTFPQCIIWHSRVMWILQRISGRLPPFHFRLFWVTVISRKNRHSSNCLEFKRALNTRFTLALRKFIWVPSLKQLK